MDLPLTDQYCASVDEASGLWIKCSICNNIKVSVLTDRPFSLAEWNRHVNNSSTHKTLVLTQQERKRIAAKLKSKDPTLSDKDRLQYRRMSMATTKMTPFFKPKPKKDAQENTQCKSDVTQASTQQQCTTAESTNATVVSETCMGESQGKQEKVLCKGIFPNFRQTSDVYDLGSLLTAFSANSDYKMGMCGSFYQCFACECNRGGAVIHDAKLRSHFFCVSCFELYKSARKMKIKQIIKGRLSRL
jgi:hypothetical protein